MRSPLLLGQQEVLLDGRKVIYALKRSYRARYVRLEIREGEGLTVIIPRRYDLLRLEEVLGRRSAWILRKLEQLSQRRGDKEQGSLRSGDSVPYLGRALRLRVARGDRRRDNIRVGQDELLIVKPSGCVDRDDVLETWFRQQAARFLKRRVALLASKLGVHHGRITIRSQKTRWASCSPKADLSFNWRLMMAPEAVIDYVIIHELTHLREMNHTDRFWKLVAERCPTWRESREWLKNHGAELSAVTVTLA